MKRNELKKMKGLTIQKDQVKLTFENEIDIVNANLKDYIKINGKNFEIDFTLENDKNNYKILSNMLIEISGLEPKLGKDYKQMES